MTNEIICFIDRIAIGLNINVDVLDQFDLIFYQKSIFLFVFGYIYGWNLSYEYLIHTYIYARQSNRNIYPQKSPSNHFSFCERSSANCRLQ